MVDEAAPVAYPSDETRQPRPAGIYEHYCIEPGCGEWGGFGFTRSKHEIDGGPRARRTAAR